MLAKRWREFSLVGTICLFGIGCGSAPPEVVTNPNPNRSLEQLKSDLAVIAEHGTGGSALQPVEIAMSSLPADNPKKEKLGKKATELIKATTDDSRKTIAKDMIQIISE